MADNNIPGTDDEDATLDGVLRDYLSSRLDGQLGRSAAHFHRHLRGAGGTGSGPAGTPRRRSSGFGPGGGWVVGIVGGALAASIAALWAGPSLRFYTPNDPAGNPPGIAINVATNAGAQQGAAGASGLQMEELTLCSQTSDGGTVLLDERTAARRLIRRELKQTRWLDPRTGASIEKIEPRQDVMLIQLDTF
jgi:hypothetical protein